MGRPSKELRHWENDYKKIVIRLRKGKSCLYISQSLKIPYHRVLNVFSHYLKRWNDEK